MEDRFDIIRIIRKGPNTGDYEAIDQSQNKNVNLRRFFCSEVTATTTDWHQQFIDLGNQLKSIKHPNVFEVYESAFDDDGPYLSGQLNSLQQISAVYPKGLNNNQLELLATQALTGLQAIHQNHLIHGAVLPNSVQVDITSGDPHYIITDLSMHYAKTLVRGDTYTYQESVFMAPEMFDGASPNVSTDIYMFGHLFYFFAAAAHPLGGMSLQDVEPLHKNHNFPSLHRVSPSISENWSEWINTLTAADPTKRPISAAQALASMPSNRTTAQPIASTVLPAQQITHISQLKATPLQPSTKSKKGLMACLAGLSIVAAGAGIIYSQSKTNKAEDSTSPNIASGEVNTPSPEPALVKKEAISKSPEKPLADQVIKRPAPVKPPAELAFRLSLSDKKAHSTGPQIEIKTTGTNILDKVISGKSTKGKLIIDSVEQIGSFSFSNKERSPFSISDFKARALATKQTGLKQGKGWNIKLIATKEHPSFKTNIFFTTNQTSLQIQISSNGQVKRTVTLQPVAKTTGRILEVTIKNAPPGTTFGFAITALGDAPKFGITAVTVER